ncbi:phosphotransferase family protein [Aquabacterium olei]|uniref:Phosphotransferase family protein n=1 Tax=Aquabacterium olei TaxID=1296669 RepID=A0A2U8FN22_9BURK|nr:phosphotransferase [Aquabacterium olei]AWI52363.1 phosphotransferase family protein [Aquabacterium olei]
MGDLNDSVFSGTLPVLPQHAFDEGRLADFIRTNVGPFAGNLQVAQFKGGQSNPTFLVQAGGERFVLRRKPPGALLPSAHAVEREHRVMSALAATDVPVPRTLALCEDPDVIGSTFFLMAHVPGRIFWDPTLPGHTPVERRALLNELNRVIAALHCVDPAAVGLSDYGKPGAYLARQVARWTQQYRAAETERIEAVDRLIEWLPAHLPSDDAPPAIVHGDYRLDNVIFHPTEPRILAVLDWELSTLGHPLVDFAYHCMTWRMDGHTGRGLGDLSALELDALGIPPEAHYVSQYCERTGRTGIPGAAWSYYLIFNLFRLTSILQGVTRRALQGNAASAEALTTGQRARPLAEQAWRMAQDLMRHR